MILNFPLSQKAAQQAMVLLLHATKPSVQNNIGGGYGFGRDRIAKLMGVTPKWVKKRLNEISPRIPESKSRKQEFYDFVITIASKHLVVTIPQNEAAVRIATIAKVLTEDPDYKKRFEGELRMGDDGQVNQAGNSKIRRALKNRLWRNTKDRLSWMPPKPTTGQQGVSPHFQRGIDFHLTKNFGDGEGDVYFVMVLGKERTDVLPSLRKNLRLKSRNAFAEEIRSIRHPLNEGLIIIGLKRTSTTMSAAVDLLATIADCLGESENYA